MPGTFRRLPLTCCLPPGRVAASGSSGREGGTPCAPGRCSRRCMLRRRLRVSAVRTPHGAYASEFRRHRAAVSVADRNSPGGGEHRRSQQQPDRASSPGSPGAVPRPPLPAVHLRPRRPSLPARRQDGHGPFPRAGGCGHSPEGSPPWGRGGEPGARFRQRPTWDARPLWLNEADRCGFHTPSRWWCASLGGRSHSAPAPTVLLL